VAMMDGWMDGCFLVEMISRYGRCMSLYIHPRGTREVYKQKSLSFSLGSGANEMKRFSMNEMIPRFPKRDFQK
jgi:hypothetical protein